MESMILLWQRIEQWFATHSPHLLALCRPGASEKELLQAEEALGVSLPEDFKTFYRLHNGGCFLTPLGYSEHITLSLAQIVEMWHMHQGGENLSPDEPPGPVQSFVWHPQWIPFLWGGYGSEFYCLDLAPGPEGQVGQIIFQPHAMQTPDLIAPSFQAFVAKAADDIEAGNYEFDPDSPPSASEWY